MLYDVAVIGAGPGGYAAALRAAELGLKTICFDPMRNPDDASEAGLGGTCANVGCVPSKALLAASLAYARAGRGEEAFGIAPAEIAPDVQRIQSHRARTVRDSNKGVAMLFRAAGVEFVARAAAFEGKGEKGWMLKDAQGAAYEAHHVIVACGTTPRELPGVPFDEKVICSNTGALAFDAVPETLGIIGAGVIGLELGSVWSRLGSRVTIFDMAQTLLPFAGDAVGKAALKELSGQGLAFELSVAVQSVERTDAGVRVVVKRGETSNEYTFDKLLIAIGRRSAVEGVNPAAAGLDVSPAGIIETDAVCRTNLEGVWAIGDVKSGPQLAHKASDEGRAVAERIAGLSRAPHVCPVPSVVYTHPEFAWVGMTDKEAKAAGLEVRTGKAAFVHNAMARACCETTGFVQLVCEAASGRLLGAQAVGSEAGNLIAALAEAIAFGATDEDLSLVIWPHPGMSEAIFDAARASLRNAKTRRTAAV